MRTKRKQNLSLLLCVLPALLVYCVFKLYPAISGVYYAMTDWNGINKTSSFVGLANFVEVFGDTNYWRSIGFTLKYVLVMVVVANMAALALAVAIESRRRAKGLYRTLFFMPNMISMRLSWTFTEVDAKLKGIMTDIFKKTAEAAVTYTGDPKNYVAGANIAGFLKVADAMMAQGIC